MATKSNIRSKSASNPKPPARSKAFYYWREGDGAGGMKRSSGKAPN